MTSKHLFCKAMKEDLRHKIWMIALSWLASFLAHPVAWLMAGEDFRNTIFQMKDMFASNEERILLIGYLYGERILMLGGLVAGAGAVIVGLFSFRFLFHKNSVDTYHSLPVKRRTLFALCYMDGFLIWFIPSLVCSLAGAAIAGGYVREFGGVQMGLELLKRLLFYQLFTSLMFLMMYNLILIAVMLSGNILNTLVSMLILGFGALAAWGLGTGFFQIYMETFFYRYWGLQTAVYGSPLLSAPMAVYMLYERMETRWTFLREPDVVRVIVINLAVTVLLGICAFVLYQKRDSEHAEQGIRNRAAAFLLRTVSTVGAGMCGWLLFSLVTGENNIFWGCFGAVLAGGLTFGVLDIIFHMEFKAFFAHKLQMALILTGTLFLCVAFQKDWFGFDTYLPEKEEIESVGIFNYSYANHRFFAYSDSADYPLEHVRLQNMETVYPFLECVTAWQENDGAFKTSGQCQQISTKVTLKNGRSYYRSYMLPKENREVILPLLADEAYLRETYFLNEDIREDVEYRFVLTRGDSRFEVKNAEPEILESFIRAFNQDLTEHPEDIIAGRGRRLAVLYINSAVNTDIAIDIYDFMERTVETLEEAGFESWVRAAEPSEVLSLDLGLDYNIGNGLGTPEKLETAARLTYGIYGEETEDALQKKYWADKEAYPEAAYEEYYGEYDGEYYIEDSEVLTLSAGLHITDPEEIAELLTVVSYELPARGTGLFQEESVRIGITDKEGKVYPAYIQKGKLPEKYIYRFREQ